MDSDVTRNCVIVAVFVFVLVLRCGSYSHYKDMFPHARCVQTDKNSLDPMSLYKAREILMTRLSTSQLDNAEASKTKNVLWCPKKCTLVLGNEEASNRS